MFKYKHPNPDNECFLYSGRQWLGVQMGIVRGEVFEVMQVSGGHH